MNTNLTPTERRIIEVLSDGFRHSMDEVKKVIDSEADNKLVYQHIRNTREKLERVGRDIAQRRQKGVTYYILVHIAAFNEDPL